jgi:hypothetical protein
VCSEGLVGNVLSGDDPNDLVEFVDDDHMAQTQSAELTKEETEKSN